MMVMTAGGGGRREVSEWRTTDSDKGERCILFQWMRDRPGQSACFICDGELVQVSASEGLTMTTVRRGTTE